jgi:catechol 2,3-dioxygenase-like lactoylglutathione lyase family enzyme
MGQHLVLLYDDLNAVVTALRAKGVELADPSVSGPNRLQTFVTDPSGNDVELHQRPRP